MSFCIVVKVGGQYISWLSKFLHLASWLFAQNYDAINGLVVKIEDGTVICLQGSNWINPLADVERFDAFLAVLQICIGNKQINKETNRGAAKLDSDVDWF